MIKYRDIYDLYRQKTKDGRKLLFHLFGIEYEVVVIGLFDHEADIAEVILESKDLDPQIKLDMPISFAALHSYLNNIA
jgi:hypothetical protein